MPKDIMESLFKEKGAAGVVEYFSFLKGAFVVTRQGIVTAANQDFLDLVGYTSTDLYGMHASQLITGDEVPAMEKRFRNRDTGRYGLKLLTRTGEVRHVLVSPATFTADDEEYRLAQFIDQTKQFSERQKLLQIKQQLEESENKFAAAFHQNQTPMEIIDLQTGCRRLVNTSLCELLGYSEAQLLSPGDEIEPHWLNPAVNPAQHQILASEGSLKGQIVQLKNGAGNTIRLIGSAVRLKINDENLAICSYFDDTGRQAAQEKAERINLLLRDIGKLAHIGGWEYDIRTREASFTDQTYDIYELPHTTPPPIEDGLSFYAPPSRPLVEQAFWNAVNKQQPYDLEAQFVTAKGRPIWVRTQGNVQLEGDEPVRVYGAIQDITQRKQAEFDVINALTETVHVIALTVETRDPYTSGHMQRVTDLATAIATAMKLDPDRIEGLRLASAIHDLGKIYIPSEILTKPGKLSSAEFNLIKTHSQVGYDIVKGIKFPWPVARIILEHHERLDGSGYPQGLKGDEICLEAQILAVADMVEAITTHRPYRAAMGIEFALDIINREAGSKLNAEVVKLCTDMIRDGDFLFTSEYQPFPG